MKSGFTGWLGGLYAVVCVALVAGTLWPDAPTTVKLGVTAAAYGVGYVVALAISFFGRAA